MSANAWEADHLSRVINYSNDDRCNDSLYVFCSQKD